MTNSVTKSLMALEKNEKEVKHFADAVDLSFNLDRQAYISEEIDMTTAETADNLIRFWNMYDEENKIPNRIKCY